MKRELLPFVALMSALALPQGLGNASAQSKPTECLAVALVALLNEGSIEKFLPDVRGTSLGEEFQKAVSKRDFLEAARIAQSVGDHTEAAWGFGKAGRTMEARAEIARIKTQIEARFGRPMETFKTVVLLSTASPETEMAHEISEVFPYFIGASNQLPKGAGHFDISTPQTCFDRCGDYSADLKDALSLIGVEVGKTVAKRHTFLSRGNLIIDPSIHQFIRDSRFQGIYVGTKEHLERFVRSHPELLVRPDASTTVDQVLSDYWGIDSSKR